MNQSSVVPARDVGLLSAIAATILLAAASWGWVPWARYTVIGIAALLAVWRWTAWRSSLVHITDRRIFLQNGRVLRMHPVESITTVATVQTGLGHVFNYGTLFIDTGGSTVVLNNLADPFEVAMNIETLRDMAIGRRPASEVVHDEVLLEEPIEETGRE